ncbi:MAG: hypothetical protein JNL32_03365 [Candidatus Kapabacteria bacterium]|nr:hypothetical protein [Candidatus Kapabacteria bacterium]
MGRVVVRGAGFGRLILFVMERRAVGWKRIALSGMATVAGGGRPSGAVPRIEMMLDRLLGTLLARLQGTVV